MGGRTGRRQDGAEEVVLAIVRGHAGELLRFARRFSLCADDAQDAYQRALEILVRKLRCSAIDNPLSYLRTIIRHEAFQVRVEREKVLCRDEVAVEEEGTGSDEDPAEQVERFERLAQTAEALQRLKPQELRALTLRAEGLSYQEICEREGWTYTRCNRSITEGRRALLERLRAIESGAECDRWFPLLSAFADGEATARQVSDLRPHLRACASCRATLRGLHGAPSMLPAIVPPELLLPALAAAGTGGGAGRHVEALLHSALDRLTGTAMRFHGALETLPGAKVAAVAASTVAVAGGGAVIERAATERGNGGRTTPVEQVAASAPARTATISLPATAATSPGSTQTAPVPPTASSLSPVGPEWAAPDGEAGGGQLAEFGFESIADAGADAPAGRDSPSAPLAPPASGTARSASTDAARLRPHAGDRGPSGATHDATPAADGGAGVHRARPTPPPDPAAGAAGPPAAQHQPAPPPAGDAIPTRPEFAPQGEF